MKHVFVSRSRARTRAPVLLVLVGCAALFSLSGCRAKKEAPPVEKAAPVTAVAPAPTDARPSEAPVAMADDAGAADAVLAAETASDTAPDAGRRRRRRLAREGADAGATAAQTPEPSPETTEEGRRGKRPAPSKMGDELPYGNAASSAVPQLQKKKMTNDEDPWAKPPPSSP